MKRTTFKKIVLDKLINIGVGTIDAFLPRKYPEARLWREILGLDKDEEISKTKISNILSKLQREGLVSRVGSRKKSEWSITSGGKKWLEVCNDKKINISKPDGVARLVIFDIPEKDKNKRNWIRSELISFGYKHLQNSVWLGETPLPREFIDKIDEFELSKFVHIFSIREKGTIDCV